MIVAIEGLDGSGKSTVIRGLSKMLRVEGIDFILTSEPTSGPIGLLLRRYLNAKIGGRNIKLEALLFAADRIWHLEAVIKPALRDGKVGITDRYKHSSIAYQAHTDKEEEWI